ncbi:MAG: cytochrome C [Nitrospirae bacterium]|nr:cytochrome C [Nitrospirota bacterium]
MESGNLSAGEERFRKFSVYRIVEHLALIACFTVLAMTGLPQKFYSLGISQLIITSLGGIDSVRSIHHVAAAIFTVLALQHIITAFIGVVFLQWEPSMLIAVKDIHDALHNVKYCLGMAGRPAMSGRYNYKEKFVYWFILLGGVQMIATGFILWFPVIAANYLPGQFIPVSKVIHTNDAMLIFLLTAIWHIYDSIFNPEVFPLDKSIFTGMKKTTRT